MQSTVHGRTDEEADRALDGREGRAFLVRFFSVPIRSDLPRLALIALAAYLATIELVYLLGYEIPIVQSLPPAITIVAPYILLAIASLVALFVKPRLGIVFALISLLVIGAARLATP